MDSAVSAPKRKTSIAIARGRFRERSAIREEDLSEHVVLQPSRLRGHRADWVAVIERAVKTNTISCCRK